MVYNMCKGLIFKWSLDMNHKKSILTVIVASSVLFGCDGDGLSNEQGGALLGATMGVLLVQKWVMDLVKLLQPLWVLWVVQLLVPS